MKLFTLLCICTLTLYATKLTRSGNYVIDDKNKLMWQDTRDNAKILFTQDHAVEYCEKLNLGGFRDWELASVKNYETIIDKTRKEFQPKVNKAFKYVRKDNYWSRDRTWVRNFGAYGYYVFFKSGTIYYQNRTYPKYVRCVRNLK